MLDVASLAHAAVERAPRVRRTCPGWEVVGLEVLEKNVRDGRSLPAQRA